jgi:hypothetical protein
MPGMAGLRRHVWVMASTSRACNSVSAPPIVGMTTISVMIPNGERAIAIAPRYVYMHLLRCLAWFGSLLLRCGLAGSKIPKPAAGYGGGVVFISYHVELAAQPR